MATLLDITKMEHYKYNMAECCHASMWQEDILGKTCLDCGFNTLHNDFGMYNNSETKGMLTRINEEIGKATPIGNTLFRLRSTEGMPHNVIIVGENPLEGWEKIRELMKETGYKPLEFGEKGRWKIPEPDIKPEQVFKIEAPPMFEEPILYVNDHDHERMFGTKQKKTRKGNNKKYFRRKRK